MFMELIFVEGEGSGIVKPICSSSVTKDGKDWFLTCVYASPHSQFRVDLWRDLWRLAANMDIPWCSLGDFNAVLRDFERNGGSSTTSMRGDHAFQNCVLDCNLRDIGYQGAPFSWRRGNTFERLDRALAFFHCPILIRFQPGMYGRNARRSF